MRSEDVRRKNLPQTEDRTGPRLASRLVKFWLTSEAPLSRLRHNLAQNVEAVASFARASSGELNKRNSDEREIGGTLMLRFPSLPKLIGNAAGVAVIPLTTSPSVKAQVKIAMQNNEDQVEAHEAPADRWRKVSQTRLDSAQSRIDVTAKNLSVKCKPKLNRAAFYAFWKAIE